MAWRPLQDSLTAYGPIGIHALLLWQAITLIPVALSLRWGWQRDLRMVWFFPLVWVGAEYLRMLEPMGFPFCSLALPAYEQLWLIQIADLGGLHLVSAVIAMGSGLLLDVWKPISRGDGFAWRGLRVSLAGFAGVMILVSAYGGIRLHQIEGDLQPGPVIAVIQPDIPLTGSEDGDYDGKRLLRELQAMSEEAAKAEPRPQLIVWPEAMSIWPLYNPGYYEQPFVESLFPEIAAAGIDLPREELAARWDARRAEYRREDAALRDWVRDLGIPLLFGQVHKSPVERDGELVFAEYNAARLIRPHGDGPPEHQLKIRLFPGGEYLPGGRERLQSLTGTSEFFTDWMASVAEIQPGKRRETFDLPLSDEKASAAFLVSICGEILFPESSGVFDDRDSRLFHISIANEGRFQRNRAQLIPYMNLPFRAIEARRAIARSANTGVSGFASPTGALYGQVVNTEGKFRTGLGFAERAAIGKFQERALTFAENPSDPALKTELVKGAEEIRRLRAEAGVSGFSVDRIDVSSHSTVYQSIGDLFPRFALLALVLATIAASIRQQWNKEWLHSAAR
jgi:apolipoprotein N-acyltransferase